ncbi:hypothetical protein Q604_UNBC06181G0001, partial [human gut metagenome]
THHGFIEQINNGDLPANSYLKKTILEIIQQLAGLT